MGARGHYETVGPRVFRVGGGDLSGSGDCLVYALDLGELVLIDCGVGPGWQHLHENLAAAGLVPSALHTLILTHAHVDHIGAAARVAADTGCRVVAHALDAPAIESGDPARTAADWHGVTLASMRVDLAMDGPELRLEFSEGALRLLHTPGHTPGSLVVVFEDQGHKLLFGQDVHGPFDPAFGSDIAAWRRSMKILLDLEADILCEGHYGVIRPAKEVRRFIEGQLQAHR
jgi:glyoxylase-like metal-dependent hydrolase (beta-lactamase superfamily II)